MRNHRLPSGRSVFLATKVKLTGVPVSSVTSTVISDSPRAANVILRYRLSSDSDTLTSDGTLDLTLIKRNAVPCGSSSSENS